MASPDRSKRKILKAKKTMPASCRKQIEILHKSKNVEALKTAAIGNNVSSDNQNSSVVINNKCRDSENDVSSLDSNKNSACSQKSKVSSQNSIKPLEIDLETRSQSTEEQAVCPYQKPSKPIESPRNLSTQEAKDSQNTSENCNKANVIRSCFEQQGEDCNLKSVSSQHSVLSSIVQMSNSAVINTLDKRIDKIVSHLETNSNSASHDKRQNDILILSSDNHFVPVDKIPTAVNSVIYSNCTSDSLKSEDSYRIYHSILLNGENTESTWLSSLDTDSNNSHNHKKRMFSENKENVKRLKTSEQINENFCVALEKQTALLEQAKIAQLHRRIKKVLLSGRNCLEPNMSSSNTSFKVVNSEALKLDKNPVNSLDERKAPVNSGPSNPSEKATEKIDLSQDHDEAVSESNDDVVLISVENPNLTTPVTSNLTDTGKITSGNFNSSNAVTEVMAVEEKNLDFVIDLTKEGLSNCNTESSVSMLESYMKSVSISKETTPMAQNETQVPESFEHLPPLPAPPQSLLDLVDKVRDTLPPQKTELKVKRVLRPRGIALTWNIAKINPKCAPVESYHLFLCHENPGIKLIWKKVGEIKALPLPMACTLSQFLASNRYYFALQSKDIFGRYGPFCDIKAIPGFSDILT
ncbi:PREDICTED: activating transcription factor 7-interacting protein 2 isoform X2 [Myotis davidii]|uniref:activating transcription factor 7-interacting protein 2 isoform X2 n=1 Tax=Myotis davidii TaxID=225400 RepID=UPI000766E89D|nr:PREDICTED: activating transcription factor 7-interacting protein 2 isoform X2 [Myotis davidii]